MKRDNSVWLNLVWACLGALALYILLRYTYLDIDYKLNVTETLLGIGTGAIGLYIASSLQKSHNRNQKLADYLQAKMDKTWDSFFIFSALLEIGTPVHISDLAKTFKSLYQDINSIRKIYAVFKLTQASLDNIETSLETLEDTLADQSQIANNIVNYQSNQQNVNDDADKVAQAFAETVREINRLN